MKISPARTAAFDVLLRIETEKAFSPPLLAVFEEKLSLKDRALCHELVLGVLRKQICLDRLISSFAGPRKLDPEVKIALRIGLFQLKCLDKIPDYSAINESVELVQRAKKTSAKGLVNAILRRATREEPDFVFADDMDRISVETSHPRWLIEKWSTELGLEEAEALARANNKQPQVSFRLTARSTHKQRLQPGNWHKGLIDGSFVVDRVDAELLGLAGAGDIYFQDEGSQMVAQAVDLDEHATFLDVCAAPGGKVTSIAASRDRGSGLLVAGDFYWPRVQLLRDNCRSQGVESVGIVQYDAVAALPFAEASFDVVLLDTPCSGTGTIRHNPELRYFLEPGDFEELSRKQLQILKNASKLVKPGGRIVYSTCSLEKEENESVCEQFLRENNDFRIVRPKVPDQFVTREGFARTFPERDGMDGFFIAAFRRS